MRSIHVNIDRPNFMINPTNCSRYLSRLPGHRRPGHDHRLSAPTLTRSTARPSPFKPKMTITQLGGHKQTKRSKDPAFASTSDNARRRQHQIARGDPAQGLRDRSAPPRQHLLQGPAASRTLHGKTADRLGDCLNTPLLDQPLSGPAYAVSGYGKLPHLAFVLAGQVTVVPEALSSSVKGGSLRTDVPVIPDVPVGHFALTLLGGKQGYLVNTRGLCAAPAVAEVAYEGQNGKSLTQKVKTKSACKAAKKTGRNK